MFSESEQEEKPQLRGNLVVGEHDCPAGIFARQPSLNPSVFVQDATQGKRREAVGEPRGTHPSKESGLCLIGPVAVSGDPPEPKTAKKSTVKGMGFTNLDLSPFS